MTSGSLSLPVKRPELHTGGSGVIKGTSDASGWLRSSFCRLTHRALTTPLFTIRLAICSEYGFLTSLTPRFCAIGESRLHSSSAMAWVVPMDWPSSVKTYITTAARVPHPASLPSTSRWQDLPPFFTMRTKGVGGDLIDLRL